MLGVHNRDAATYVPLTTTWEVSVEGSLGFETKSFAVNRGARAYAESPAIGAFTAAGTIAKAKSAANVNAHVDAGARLSAGDAVDVEARTVNEARVRAQAQAFAGVSLGATEAFADADGTTTARLNGNVQTATGGAGAASVGVTAQSLDIVEGEARTTNGALGAEASDTGVDAAVDSFVEASVGVGAVVRASGDIVVRALSEADAHATGRGTGFGLGGSFGTARATAEIASDVDATVGANATLSSTSGAVKVEGFHNYTTGGNVIAGRTAEADAFAPGGAVIAVKVSPAEATSKADVEASIGNDSSISAGGAVSVRALSNNDADANSRGIAVGVGGFGVTTATAEATGTTLANMAGRITSANAMVVESIGRNTAQAIAETTAGGIAGSGSATVATATVDPTIHATVSDGGIATAAPDIHLTGGASKVRAESIADANADAIGITIALGASAGGSVAEASITPEVRASIGSNVAIDGSGSLSVEARHNSGAEHSARRADADAQSSSGGVITGSGADADANSSARRRCVGRDRIEHQSDGRGIRAR